MDKKERALESWGLAGAGLLVSGVSVWVLMTVLSAQGPAHFADVAALILVGFAAFVILMNVLSFSAYILGITNNSQPFGLPEGTVRALLTLAFIVLVGVLASYLVTSGSRSSYEERSIPLRTNLSKDEAYQFSASYKGIEGVVIVEEMKPTASPQADAKDATAKDGAPKDGAKQDGANAAKYSVQIYPRADNHLADDISKQILTMLSTILASMIGFYFGARTDSASSEKKTEAIPQSPESQRAEKLLKKAKEAHDAVTPDARNKLSDLIVRIGNAKAEIEAADAVKAAPGATKDAKDHADAAKTAVSKKLDEIEKELGALPRSPS